jgi:hypothetical protein
MTEDTPLPTHQLRITQHPGYLHVAVSGVNSKATVERYLREAGSDFRLLSLFHLELRVTS